MMIYLVIILENMYLYSNYKIFSAKKLKDKCKTVSTNIKLKNENKIKITGKEKTDSKLLDIKGCSF